MGLSSWVTGGRAREESRVDSCTKPYQNDACKILSAQGEAPAATEQNFEISRSGGSAVRGSLSLRRS